ncbi:nucleotidyltransferase domain-containing protein [Elusimicrobiota bacterium]
MGSKQKAVIPASHLSVLEKILSKLSNSKINWALTGSMNFALQGVPVTPNDIDIQTDKDGAFEIEKIFSQYITKKVVLRSTEKIKSYFGELAVGGVKVEIMGDIQKCPPDGTWELPVNIDKYKKFVIIEKMQIPVLSLAYEYQAYKVLGRIEKAEMLKRFLQQK